MNRLPLPSHSIYQTAPLKEIYALLKNKKHKSKIMHLSSITGQTNFVIMSAAWNLVESKRCISIASALDYIFDIETT